MSSLSLCISVVAMRVPGTRQFRTLLFRNTPKSCTRKGTVLRVRPAVGDQSGSLTESNTKEHDSDWIKIQDYVKTLNPRILGEAQDALNRKKWKGEGVQQATYESSCVSDTTKISVLCSSNEVMSSVSQALSAIGDAEPPVIEERGAEVLVGGLTIRVAELPSWIRRMRNFRNAPPAARISGIELLSHSEAIRDIMQERDLETKEAADGSLVLSSLNKGSELTDNLRIGFSKVIDVLPPIISIGSTPPIQHGTSADSTLVKEVVLGAAWEDHPLFERELDKLFGTNSRVSLGLWKPPSGPLLRLIPTDETGLKTIVMFPSNLTAAQERLAAAGFKTNQFPGYWAVSVGGLDLRLAEKEEPDSWYDEVRWEVRESETLSSGGGGSRNVSCVGAITHGVVKSAQSGALSKKLRE